MKRMRRMIWQGYSNDRIAQLLDCHPGDVEYIRSNGGW